MVQHTLEILEFSKIKENIAQYCLSASGKKKLLSQGIETLEAKWKEKTEAVFALKKMMDDNLYFPDLFFPDVENQIDKIRVEGAVLDCPERASIALYLKSAFKLKKHLYQSSENLLIRKNLDFDTLDNLLVYISKYVSDDGTFRDENVKELSAIRSRISSVNKKLSGIVSHYANDSKYSGFLQEGFSTMRDNRVVLSLKENFRGRIKGISHGSSSTGMTIYLEPVEMFELNNEITELEERYRQEIHKILKELTFEIRDKLEIIENICRKISFVDTIIARAKFAFFNKAVMPETSDNDFVLKKARHFLLGKNSVPIDIVVSGKTKALLISGPNTGGKTVALKTAALSVLMNQFSVGILAEEGSELPVFDNVLADIGDEQSISGSLSTFSAHMRNISEIIEKCTEKSLVVLDEPGTGTDPEEGAALTMAVFDTLIERKTIFLATTHQGILKNYAAGKEEIQNASVKYDSETYRPEYLLVYGLPGESFGIDIAMKTGLDSIVIERARKYIGSEKVNINELLREISLKQIEIRKREEETAVAERKTVEARRTLALREIELRRVEHNLKNSEKREVKRFLRESRKKIENLIRSIVENQADEQSRKNAREYIEELEKETEKYEERAALSVPEFEIETGELDRGSEIYIGETKVRGEILEKLKNGKFLVASGSMKLVIDRDMIKGIAPPGSRQKEAAKKIALHLELNNTAKPQFEIDLRGMRVDEALGRLERQMDSALLSRLSSFSVIHGLGEGILKKAVTDYLESSKAVRKHYFADPESGGFGKTIVEL